LGDRQLVIAVTICSAFGLSACEITSAGLELGGVHHLVVEWRGTDAQGGEMSTRLPDGRLYCGICASSQSQGEIVANLFAEDGRRLRCRFHLEQPLTGMNGGGSGYCETNSAELVPARLQPL